MAPGLNSDYGDEDLFGHETPNLKQAQKSLAEDMTRVGDVMAIQSNVSATKSAKLNATAELIRRLSNRIENIRTLKVKQTFGLKKFFKLGGEDWRNSKYLYAISSTIIMLNVFLLLYHNLIKCI